MSTPPQKRRLRLAGTGAAVALLAAGCSLLGTQDHDSETSPTPEGTVQVGDGNNASEQPKPQESTDDQAQGEDSRKEDQIDFARQVTEVMLTWDPEKDLNRTSGVLQAREFMIPERAEKVGAPERPASGELWRWGDETGAVAIPTVYVPSQSFDSPGQDLPGAATQVRLTASVTWYPDGNVSSRDGRFDSEYELYFTITNDKPYQVVDFTMETTNWGKGR